MFLKTAAFFFSLDGGYNCLCLAAWRHIPAAHDPRYRKVLTIPAAGLIPRANYGERERAEAAAQEYEFPDPGRYSVSKSPATVTNRQRKGGGSIGASLVVDKQL